MANTIGTLLVELGLNSASFVEGMDKATYKAKQAAKEIGDSLEGMGETVSRVLGNFGELGAAFGESFAGVGQVLSSVAGELGSLGGAAGGAVVGVGALVAAGVAAEGMFVGLALHSAESAGELYKMSLQTGVSVETLSTLGFAAREVGVSTESLVRSLQLMSKSAFAAETGTGKLTNGFARLKIDVQDSNGHMKDSGALFTEVVEKLGALDNAGEKIALAKQIFGRGGAELLPLIAEGSEGITELTERAKALGLEVSTNTAAAAEDFEKDLRAIKEGATGVGNQLLTALLPTFKIVADAMVEGLKDVVEWTRNHADMIKTVTQYIASFGGLVWMVFKDFIDIIREDVKEVMNLYSAIVQLGKGVKDLSWSEIKKGGTDAANAVKQSYVGTFNDLKKNAGDYADFVAKVFSDSAPKAGKKAEGGGVVDTASVDKSTLSIMKQIDALQQAAKAQLDLASAASRSQAQLLLLTADEEADTFIKKLEAEAATKVGTEHDKLISIINKHRQAIHAWKEEQLAANDAIKINEELDKGTLALQRQIDGVTRLGAAYRAGGQAILDAQIAAAVDKDAQEVDKLQQEYDELSKKPGHTQEALDKLQAALDAASGKLQIHRDLQKQLIELKIEEPVAKQTNSLRAEAAAFELTAAAALKSAAAQREAAAQAAAAKFAVENPGASRQTLDEVYQNALKTQQQAYQQTVLSTAAQYDLNKQYDDTITKLTAAREVLVKNGQDTILIDAQIYDAQQKLAKSWDEAAIKVGGFKDKVAGVLDEIRLDGDNMWASIAGAGKTALDGLADAFAKLATTGKGSFKEVFKGFEENIAKASFKSLEGQVAGGVEKLFGLGAGSLGGTKPDGSSETNALWVQLAGQGGDLAGGPGGIFDSIKNLFGGNEEEGSEQGGGGGIGGFFSNALSSIFGGFLADGGDVTPGKAYVVGEKHPEFFIPGKTGSVVPTLKTDSNQVTNLSVHFHGVTDADSFKKNKTQIAGTLHRAASAAFARGV